MVGQTLILDKYYLYVKGKFRGGVSEFGRLFQSPWRKVMKTQGREVVEK